MDTPQRDLQHPFQLLEWLQKRLPLRENEQSLARDQLVVQLSHKGPKDTLSPITPDRIPKSPADHDSHPARSIIHLVSQEVEQSRRDPTPMALNRLDIPASS
ncbi:MAG TPA: hypothetical protein VLE03_00550 [Nitrospiraceae bacterium]|nr:hypothetical protein [Nitrospiraceae bacterium]